MKRYLLDTHVLLRWRAGELRGRKRVRSILSRPRGSLWLSVASVWEICIKRALGKLDLPMPTKDFVEGALAAGLDLLPIRPAHVYRVETLPGPHRDPFDRLLVAQALEERLVLVSGDPQLAGYDVDVVW